MTISLLINSLDKKLTQRHKVPKNTLSLNPLLTEVGNHRWVRSFFPQVLPKTGKSKKTAKNVHLRQT